ncbi:hypothetical protein [Pseudomonas sp. REST10]|uniref:hypothetical protein n=1 Tax=Pseudomonas sp. REST10 TaxID=2512235 RepID=UPI00240DDA3D|nr:hypothetical protein [Pseudomonas sp. REST10]|tara:strand:- start:822 stop:1043 length:222 start_codon:yes stop_codon:yes gene_type:complete
MQAVDTIGCNIDDITTFAQALVEIVGSFKLVLNDQDSHARDNLDEIDKEFFESRLLSNTATSVRDVQARNDEP